VVKRPGRESDNSPPSSDVKNAWSHTSTPPYVCMTYCLVTYRIHFQGLVVKHTDLTRHKDVWGSGGIAPCTVTSVLHGVEWSASSRGRFIPGEKAPGTHWIRWVGSRAGLDVEAKKKNPCPCGGSNAGRPAHSCHYTESAYS
jgi:hypothetical protein